VAVDEVDQAEPVVGREGEEARRDLDDVEVEGLAEGEVTRDGGGGGGLGEDVLDPAALAILLEFWVSLRVCQEGLGMGRDHTVET